MNAATLTQNETNMLTQALRALQREAADAANSFDRAYGPTDGRSKEAWTKAAAQQRAASELGRKLGLSV